MYMSLFQINATSYKNLLSCQSYFCPPSYFLKKVNLPQNHENNTGINGLRVLGFIFILYICLKLVQKKYVKLSIFKKKLLFLERNIDSFPQILNEKNAGITNLVLILLYLFWESWQTVRNTMIYMFFSVW